MPKKWHSCVQKVRRKGGVRSPEAVCSAATGYVRKKGGGWRKRKRKTASSRRRKERWY